MTVETTLLISAAVAFAVVTGANDGGALIAMGMKIPSIKPLGAILMLAAAVVAGPILIGTQVANTLAHSMVRFDGGAGKSALLVAILSAVLVVTVLSRRGLPTSLTLALIGGITGAGFAYHLPVLWGMIGFVLIMGMAAPFISAASGFVFSRFLLGRIPARGLAARRICWAHRFVFGLQCLAYSVNDGQKILAIFAISAGTASGTLVGGPWQILAIGLLFMLGVLISIRKFARSLGAEIMLVRPANAIAAEFSSAAAVFGTTALGAPVSMTQSVAAALVGSGLSEGYGKIRWRAASRIVLAWVFTFPTAAVLAAAVASIGSVVS